jgi:ABC-type antimicrobial peptide transport system permease subunit
MALGATRRAIMRLVLAEGAWMVGAGVAIGLAAAYLARHVLEDMVFGIPTTDPITYASAVLIALVAGTGACALPASRAASIDPILALREE